MSDEEDPIVRGIKDGKYIQLRNWDTWQRIQGVDELDRRDSLIRHKIKLKNEGKHVEAEAVQEFIDENY